MRREVEAWIEGYEGRSGGIYKSVRVLTSDPETEGLRPPGIMYIPGIFNNRNKIKKKCILLQINLLRELTSDPETEGLNQAFLTTGTM
jgi:hypothetical protein